ncbi:MAG: UTP--glucose-1-phosphate uridylyltransferase, partial [Kiritimatiellae bacterium]|nr:UTP--glucose-1-phosphate uridylyltransferase [Kiritimatiellia bacterium]
MSEQLHSIHTRLSDDHAPALLIDQFLGHVQRVQTGASGVVPQAQLLEIGPLPGHASLQTYAARGQAALDALVVLKLNGGLGTSMGLDRAKSLLPVRDKLRFIDLIARQILSLRARYGATLPLLLMNSASTVQDTTEALAHYPELQTGQGELPIGFLQHREIGRAS